MPVTLNYQSHGSGRPVLVLHGLFGSSHNWTAFAKKLAARYRVITVDLRNHGNSGHTDSMTYPEMAEDIHLLLRDHGLAQSSIIGHSMGGKVAMTFALTYSNLIEKLVVLDIAPVFYPNNYPGLLENLSNLPLSELTGRRHADKLLAGRITDTPLRLFLLQNLVPHEQGYRWRVNLAALRNNLAEISGFPAFDGACSHTGPTLFLGGSKSAYLHPDHMPEIHRRFSQPRIEYIDAAGHWLHVDQPDAVLASISDFLVSD